MGNAIRCCIACILPCGALDVVRIVHANGHVEEFSKALTAGEVMKANPKHVLRKSSCQGIVRRIVVLPPEAALQRGKIYFLIPTSTAAHRAYSGRRLKGLAPAPAPAPAPPDLLSNAERTPFRIKQCQTATEVVVSAHDLAGVFSGRPRRRKGQPERRRISRVGVWKPHLQSISEVASL